MSDKNISAAWNRAALVLRLRVEPMTSLSNWGLTLAEAKDLHRRLGWAIEDGDKHMAEMAGERKAS